MVRISRCQRGDPGSNPGSRIQQKEVKMTCANWMLTIFGAAILVFTIWPTLIGSATKWVIIVLAALIILTAWTAVQCKCCKNKKK